MITIILFYKKGLKRGSPINTATFEQVVRTKLDPLFPGVTTYRPLAVQNQVGNVYSLSADSLPTPSQPIAIRVTIGAFAHQPGVRPPTGDQAEVVMNDGESSEVWIGYER